MTDDLAGHDLVPYVDPPCVHCGTPPVTVPTATQGALFRHGGYGATTATHHVACPTCGLRRATATVTLNPRHHP